ncbi:MAG: hypothetical protein ACYTHN_22240, partial [Planctomycetota bacterium]
RESGAWGEAEYRKKGKEEAEMEEDAEGDAGAKAGKEAKKEKQAGFVRGQVGQRMVEGKSQKGHILRGGLHIKISQPKNPKVKAAMLAYQARTLREQRGENPMALMQAYTLLMQAKALCPGHKIVKIEYENLANHVKTMKTKKAK